MPSQYRSKTPYKRKVNTRESFLVVLAVEGERTEVQYFERLQTSNLKILAIPPVNGNTSPEHILNNLKKYLEKNSLYEDDLVWLLIDRDRWTQAQLSSVIAQCTQYSTPPGINLAVSNPCFEIWLILHHTSDLNGISSSASAIERLKQLRSNSYNKSNCPVYSEEEINLAISNSLSNSSCNEILPSAPGTRIHLLVKAILKLRAK